MLLSKWPISVRYCSWCCYLRGKIKKKKKKNNMRVGLWLTFGWQRFIIEQHTFSSPCQPIMWSGAIHCEAIHVNSYEFKTTPRTLIIQPNFLVYLTRCWKTSAVYVQTSTTKLPAQVWGFAWSRCLEVIRARRHVAIGWLTTRRNLFDNCDARCLTEVLATFQNLQVWSGVTSFKHFYFSYFAIFNRTTTE